MFEPPVNCHEGRVDRDPDRREIRFLASGVQLDGRVGDPGLRAVIGLFFHDTTGRLPSGQDRVFYHPPSPSEIPPPEARGQNSTPPSPPPTPVTAPRPSPPPRHLRIPAAAPIPTVPPGTVLPPGLARSIRATLHPATPGPPPFSLCGDQSTARSTPTTPTLPHPHTCQTKIPRAIPARLLIRHRTDATTPPPPPRPRLSPLPPPPPPIPHVPRPPHPRPRAPSPPFPRPRAPSSSPSPAPPPPSPPTPATAPRHPPTRPSPPHPLSPQSDRRRRGPECDVIPGHDEPAVRVDPLKPPSRLPCALPDIGLRQPRDVVAPGEQVPSRHGERAGRASEEPPVQMLREHRHQPRAPAFRGTLVRDLAWLAKQSVSSGREDFHRLDDGEQVLVDCEQAHDGGGPGVIP